MSVAKLFIELNSSSRFGELACALALLPILLWPGLARGHCCCTGLGDHSLVELASAEVENSKLSEAVVSSASGGSLPPQLKVNSNCPHCITKPRPTIANRPAELAILASQCDCQNHLLASFLSPRVDSSPTAPRTVNALNMVTAIFPVLEWPLPVLGGDGSVRLLSPSALQRRALLCCWLN